MAKKTDLNGTKLLIAAAAVSGTLGGWILLSMTGTANTAASGSIQDPGILDLLNQPMPTLAQSNGSIIGPGLDAANPAANPSPQLPALRRVVAPSSSGGAPGAAAVSRSSRR